MRNHLNARIGLLAGLITVALASAGTAEPEASFYAGKTITLTIGSGVGGSYDTTGRLVAQYLKNHIPGNPTVVPQNMPGASSVRATEYIFNVAPRDGTALGFVQPSVVLNKVLDPKAKYDPRRLTWIGRLQRMVLVGIVRQDAPVHSVEEAEHHELIVAGNAASGPGVMVPWTLNALIGTKFKVVRGYESAAANLLALERGEVQGIGSTSLADVLSRPSLTENKVIDYLYVIDVERSPKIPNIRTIVELGKGPEDKAILGLLGNPSSIGQAVMAPPDVPQERVALLRQAFAEMLKDPQFIADAKQRQIEIAPMSGPDLSKLVGENFEVAPQAVDRLKAIVAPK